MDYFPSVLMYYEVRIRERTLPEGNTSWKALHRTIWAGWQGNANKLVQDYAGFDACVCEETDYLPTFRALDLATDLAFETILFASYQTCSIQWIVAPQRIKTEKVRMETCRGGMNDLNFRHEWERISSCVKSNESPKRVVISFCPSHNCDRRDWLLNVCLFSLCVCLTGRGIFILYQVDVLHYIAARMM